MSETGSPRIPSWAGSSGASSHALERAVRKAVHVGLLKVVNARPDAIVREGQLLRAALSGLTSHERAEVHRRYTLIAPALSAEGLVLRLPE